jgi:hypothetical protein
MKTFNLFHISYFDIKMTFIIDHSSAWDVYLSGI